MNDQIENPDLQLDQPDQINRAETLDPLEQAKAELLQLIADRSHEAETEGATNGEVNGLADEYAQDYLNLKTKIQNPDLKDFRRELSDWQDQKSQNIKDLSNGERNAHCAVIQVIINALQAQSSKKDVEKTNDEKELEEAVLSRPAEYKDPKQILDIQDLIKVEYAEKYHALKKNLERIDDYDKAQELLDRWREKETKSADLNHLIILPKGTVNNGRTIISVIIQTMQEKYLKQLLEKHPDLQEPV